jgi:ATP-dependent RNA helicase DDX35
VLFSHILVYNAFNRYDKSSSWCRSHAVSFQALSRAASIRSQLQKYCRRFGVTIESCNGDVKRLRQCLVRSYWRNSARWMGDGTYRSVHGGLVGPMILMCCSMCDHFQVLHVHPKSVLFGRKPKSGWVIFHEVQESKMMQCVYFCVAHYCD